MSNDENTLKLLTPEQIHPVKVEFPFGSLLHIGDLLDELNQRARSYEYMSMTDSELQQKALADFATYIAEDGRRFLPVPEVDEVDKIYFTVAS